jgi:acetyl-CoA C-acetyltransferase
MPKTVILSAARTPIGKLGGGLASVDATELGGTAIRAALERAEVAPEQVQHVVMGQVLQAGQGQIPSRQAQIKAGIPKEVPSETINKVCASGIRAAGMIDAAVRAGDLDIAVGGGMESMSKAPYMLKGARFGFRMGDGVAIDAMINDGLTNPFSGKHMAQEASEVAAELEMTRADMDRWAVRSHELAIKATDEGRLPEEIVAVTIKGRKGDTTVEVDEAPRRAGACLRRVGQDQRQVRTGDDHRPGRRRRRLPIPGPHPGQGGGQGAGEGRTEGRGHRPVGDQ